MRHNIDIKIRNMDDVKTPAFWRRTMADYFDRLSRGAAVKALKGKRYFVPKKVYTSYLFLCEETKRLTCANLAKDPHEFTAPSQEFLCALEFVLSDKTVMTYEQWIMRDDVTDEELLAFAEAHKDLEWKWDEANVFRDPARAKAYLRPFNVTFRGDKFKVEYIPMDMFCNNLRVLLTMLVFKARAYNAFEAARPLLLAASKLTQAVQRPDCQLSEDEVAVLVENIRIGINELGMRRDFESFDDWADFRKRIGAALKEEGVRV